MRPQALTPMFDRLLLGSEEASRFHDDDARSGARCWVSECRGQSWSRLVTVEDKTEKADQVFFLGTAFYSSSSCSILHVVLLWIELSKHARRLAIFSIWWLHAAGSGIAKHRMALQLPWTLILHVLSASVRGDHGKLSVLTCGLSCVTLLDG